MHEVQQVVLLVRDIEHIDVGIVAEVVEVAVVQIEADEASCPDCRAGLLVVAMDMRQVVEGIADASRKVIDLADLAEHLLGIVAESHIAVP